MRKPVRTCLSLLLLGIFLRWAQVSLAQDSTGLPRYGSFSATNIDTINLSNLNVHIDIPLFQKQSRGYLISYEFTCDSTLYEELSPYQVYPISVGCQILERLPNPAVNVQYSTTPSLCNPETEPDGPYSYSYFNFMSIDPNNTPHPYNITTVDNTECGGGVTTAAGYATDGSGYYLSASGINFTVTDLGHSCPRQRFSRTWVVEFKGHGYPFSLTGSQSCVIVGLS